MVSSVPGFGLMRKLNFSIWILLGILLGIAVGAGISFLLPTQYLSTAELQVTPCKIPERFVGPASAPPIQQSLDDLMRQLLSRAQLASVIQANNLYGVERGRLPIEDVLAIMRKDIRVWTQTEDSRTTVYLSFQYKDKVQTQMAAADLAGRLLGHYHQSRIARQTMILEFLGSMLDKASREWLALKQGKGAAADRSELRALDIESARRHYESVRQKLIEAQVLDEMQNRQLGEMLELTAPPSLPAKPVSPRRETFMAGGALVGLLASLVFLFIKKPGGRKPPSFEAIS